MISLDRTKIFGILSFALVLACGGSSGDDDSGDDDGSSSSSSSSSSGAAAAPKIMTFAVDPKTAVVDVLAEHSFSFVVRETELGGAKMGVALLKAPSGVNPGDLQKSGRFALSGNIVLNGDEISSTFGFKPPVAGDYELAALVQIDGTQTLSEERIVITATDPQ